MTPSDQKRPLAIEIAPMTAADVEAVVDIENRSQPSPWPAHAFREQLAQSWSHTDMARMLSPPARAPRVIGFCNYWLVADELQLHNLAVHPEYRRRGVARQLLGHVLSRARAAQASVVILEVRAGNSAARALYTAHGFRDVVVRKHYYPDNREHAVVMKRDMGGATATRERPGEP